jgi:hypothetical protein
MRARLSICVEQQYHKKRPSFVIILSTNYHRINVSQFEFVELFLLSFTELQRRIGEIRTLYINCWARKKQ